MSLREATTDARRFWKNVNDGEYGPNLEPVKVLKVLFEKRRKTKPTLFDPDGLSLSSHMIVVVECRDHKVRFMEMTSQVYYGGEYGPDWDCSLSFPRVCKIPKS